MRKDSTDDRAAAGVVDPDQDGTTAVLVPPAGYPTGYTAARSVNDDPSLPNLTVPAPGAQVTTVPAPATPDPVVVDIDTWIDRPDLGPGAHTLVAAGDPVPAGLLDLPRRPAAG